MNRRFALAVGFLLATSAGAFANSTAPTYTSILDKILQGHGVPGDSAVSASNPDITFRVLSNGTIEKRNARYNRVEIVKPTWRLGMSPRERKGL